VGANQTLKVILAHRLHFSQCGSVQQKFETMRKQEAPKNLARTVYDLYFEPTYEEFRSRTIWSLSNAFTSSFKELDPIPQFKATAKLANS
jgi:hypothetical protein